MADIKSVIDKLDKMDTRLDSIDVTLGKQQVSLDYHIARTNQNEETIEILKNESDIRLRKLESWKDKFLGILAFLGFVSAIAAFLNDIK